MAHVLLSPLNWGLGHATRDIPIVKVLLEHNHEVTIAAYGNARVALKKEFPECRCIEFPDYPAPYSTSRFFLPKLVASLPLLLRDVAEERRNLEHILARDHYDLIISDNRIGVYSSKTPSLFVTHQLHYHLPFILWPVEFLALYVNQFLYQKYDRIIVPDNSPGPTALAGKLSRPGTALTRSRVFFAGILSGIQKMDAPADLDNLVLISGPEPQRTLLEEILLPQVKTLTGKTVILLGSPQKTFERQISDTCTIRAFASNAEKGELMNRARWVICRSGYTSMMELAELDKRHVLLIPTPGQTEQEYLSWYYANQRWCFSQSQYRLDLLRDLTTAKKYTGFPPMNKTAENVQDLYERLLAGYLE